MSNAANPFAEGYSRCREISNAHLSVSTQGYLAERAHIDTPIALRFVAFDIPFSGAFGARLASIPWTDANLLREEGITAEQLSQIQQFRGLPDDLRKILHLAGQAGMRIVIFDPDAPVLDGLPCIRQRNPC